jgi:hypothetical protein
VEYHADAGTGILPQAHWRSGRPLSLDVLVSGTSTEPKNCSIWGETDEKRTLQHDIFVQSSFFRSEHVLVVAR